VAISTPEDRFASLSAALHDFKAYHPHLKIQDRATHMMVPLAMTPIQRAVRAPILSAEREGRPARVIVLKARREGVSTIIQATFCHRGCTRQNVKAFTIADERDKASNLHGMLEGMYHNLPSRLKPTISNRDTGKRLRLVGGADFRTETAKDANAGRSAAASLLHASEFAFWDYPEKTLVSMLQVVPDSVGTIVFIESTANGVGNGFHQEWLRAQRKESAYVPLFFSWLDDPGYDHGDVAWERLGDLSDDEQLLVEDLGARPGQLAWRRHKLNQDLLGDIKFFNQEYPATWQEAFLSTGRHFFPPGYLVKFRPQEPRARFKLTADFKRSRKADKTAPGAERDEKGPLWIYELPKDDTRYVIFVDPAGVVGELRAKHFSSTEDPSDYTCMWVVNCRTLATAAVWHDRIDIGLAGLEAAKLGVLYKRAVLCAETTGGYGFVLTEKWREIGYSPIHRDRQRNQYERNRVHTYGFATTTATRPLMLEGLKSILREDPSSSDTPPCATRCRPS
jgi:hypothetical protein